MGLDNPLHILLLLLVIALLFGAKRLPELGRSLGEGMRGFKESLTGHSQQPEQPNQLNAQAPAPPPPPQPSGQPAEQPSVKEPQ